MAYVIYQPKEAAHVREQELTIAGVKAGFFPEGERYDQGGLLTEHPTENKAAIKIFKSPGVLTPLSQPDIMPCNYEPLFTADELANAVEQLTEDWITPYMSAL